MEEFIPQEGSIEAKDNFAPAPSGHALTDDNQQWAWGKPPKVVDPEMALQQAINSLKQDRIQLEMMKLLVGGASIEMIVEGYLFQAFQEGRFMPDVGLLIKAPLAFYIASLAEEANIPYRFFENKDALDEGTMSDETLVEMMQQNNPSMFNFLREKMNEDIRKGKKPLKGSEGFLGVRGDKK
tara:strand:+ start:1844 stop:2389 length:546 start_codon:yes stop_codon:yes gene_type:complete